MLGTLLLVRPALLLNYRKDEVVSADIHPNVDMASSGNIQASPEDQLAIRVEEEAVAAAAASASTDHNLGALLCLLGAFFSAVTMLVIKVIGKRVSSFVLATWFHGSSGLLGENTQ